jgi:hypothetical protein
VGKGTLREHRDDIEAMSAFAHHIANVAVGNGARDMVMNASFGACAVAYPTE